MGQTIKLQRGFGESHGRTTPGCSVSWHLKYSLTLDCGSFELQGLAFVGRDLVGMLREAHC